MTTIVAVRDGARTLIGSDTIALEDHLIKRCGSKWVTFGQWGVGISGDLRTVNICTKHAKRLFDDLAGAFEFTERFFGLLQEYGYDMKPGANAAPPNGDQSLVLARPDNIWEIGSDMSIVQCERFWAEGSGQRFALGAMYAMREIDDAERVLRAGLAAAFEYDAGTGGEIWTDVLEA